MRRFTEVLAGEIEIKDLDIQYPYYGPEKDHDDIEIMNDVDVQHKLSIEVPPVNIDEVIEVLHKLKAKGANKVILDVNSENQGYIFTGIKVTEIS